MGYTKSGGAAAKAVAVGVVASLIGAACSTATTSTLPAVPSSPAPGQAATGCLVSEAWNAYAEERIAMWDQPAIEKPIEAAGGTYEFADAKSSYDYEAQEVDAFVASGAKVVVVRAVDTVKIVPTVERAAAAGVPVIAYDHLVDSPKALLVAFDPVETGRMEARAILAARPKGNYVIIKGHPEGQLEPDLIASGIHEVLQPAIDRGDIKIVAETYTVNWDPDTAQTEMETILSENHNQIDAVIAESDGMAGGAIAALKQVGLHGEVAVAGQGGDMWGFNRVALGTQTVDIWPDLRLLGKAAGDAAVALCNNPDISRVKGARPFTLVGHDQVTSIMLAPQAITKENLNLVIDSAWAKKPDVCASVDPSAAPPACR
jgi:D-xylose transport system substrate-binding protein